MEIDPWIYLRRKYVPAERLSLELLGQSPELRDEHGRLAVPNMVAIWTPNLRCRGYCRPDLGYLPQQRRGPKP
jgi:hypothetical protein